MKRVILLFVSLAVMAFQLLFAQSFTVKGKVIAEEGNEPLIGVAIMQEGTNNGVITDIDGNYSIEIKGVAQATLVYSYIGMQQQQHVVTPQTQKLDITLKSDAQLVDEVVVVAYGVRKKGTVTGSVSTIKAEKMESVPAAGFDQALQGQTPGLMVMSNSGEPSKAAAFQIRGTNSITSGTSPLFILDGVPISSSDFNTISPSDIENISVLKDASSTSIYGARAANGVVVITTKRGRSMDKAHITLRTQWGISQLAKGEWNLMNTAERIQFEKEVGLDAGQDYDLLSQTDVNWRDMVFNDNAMLQNYDLSINRATERLNYFVSGSFYDQDGIAQGSMFRRYSMRANAEVKASNWLKVGTNSMVTYEEVEQADQGSYSLSSPISACRFMLPYWNPYNPDGSLATNANGGWTGTTVNPIEWMDNNPVTNKKYKVLSVLFAEVTPIENMTYRVQFGADYTHSTGFMQSFPSYQLNNGLGVAGRQSNDILNLTVTNTLNYRFDVRHDHHFNVMVGQEGVDYQAEGFNVTTRGQNNDFLTNVTSGTRASSWQDNTTAYSFLSFFGRAEYNYDDRYYVELGLRTDASSRFGKDHRWGKFWSVGLMWNAKKERFLQKYDWLHNAQVSFSTGTSGNSEIPNFDHLALASGGWIYMDAAGIAPQQKGNEKLSWETTWTTNLGFHLGFFERFNVDLELYHKRTSDMLMEVPQSYSEGNNGFRWDNIGVMTNMGVELAINADVLRLRDFVWNLSANVSYNKNEIKELYNGVQEYELPNTSTKWVVGRPLGEFYINRYAGVNPANGDPLWYDKEGNLTTEFRESDKVMVGKNYLAPWQGGFGTTLTWKGISVNAQFSWVADRWMFNNDRFFEESNGLYTGFNQSKRLLYDRWKKPGDVTDIPRWGVTPQMDSRFLEDASFLRLKNLMISYTFPQEWMKKTNFFTNARIYAQGQNLLTFTKFSGLDPEAFTNMYQAQYPMSRQYSFGLELSF
jgi:TonB-linked SusC/RagA family outer membrane protein